MIQDNIKNQIKDAMRARDELRLLVLRGLIAGFENENVAKKRKPDEPLSDEDALAVIARQAKQRKDSIEQFAKGGRQELADKEAKELEILNEFLPEMMSVEEITKIAEAKVAELGITDIRGKGALMGALMGELRGKADGSDVNRVLESLFADQTHA
jgi:uncharacterized protein